MVPGDAAAPGPGVLVGMADGVALAVAVAVDTAVAAAVAVALALEVAVGVGVGAVGVGVAVGRTGKSAGWMQWRKRRTCGPYCFLQVKSSARFSDESSSRTSVFASSITNATGHPSVGVR